MLLVLSYYCDIVVIVVLLDRTGLSEQERMRGVFIVVVVIVTVLLWSGWVEPTGQSKS